MVKQASSNRQRKTRLDKAGEKTEFIGFGAFAASASPPQLPSASQASLAESSSVSYQWSTIYTSLVNTDHDDRSSAQQQQHLSLLFTRMAQKRDPITVAKAVQEWEQSYLLSSDVSKPVKAHALKHYAWLYGRRLYWENSTLVRAAALRVWWQAVRTLPRVVTGLVMEQPVLLGLWCAARSDPDLESNLQQHNEGVSLLFDNNDWPWLQGLLEHSSTVLSYGRASALHEALFPSNNKSATTNDNTDPKRLEQNRDAQEERWERAVATCLDALTRWIQQQQQHDDDDDSSSSSISAASRLWWKTLSSPKARLRRHTYQLLSAVALKAPHLLLDHIQLCNALSQAVSSEKEAVNVPVLMETVLTVMVQQRKSSNPRKDFLALATTLTKPLVKAWRKANYGASMTVWGPMMLPLVAQFPTTAQQVQLLQAAHEGRQWVLGHKQQLLLLQAIAESTSFVLLRQRVQDSGDDDDNNDVDSRNQNARSLAQIWLSVFQLVVLSSAASHHNTKTRTSSTNENNHVLQGLVRDLAKQLMHFGSSLGQSSSATDNLFQFIQEWFWQHGLTLMPTGVGNSSEENDDLPPVLVQLLKELIQFDATESTRSDKMRSRLCPLLRQRFQYEVARFKPGVDEAAKSPAPSTVTAYRLLDALLEYGGPLTVLIEDESLVKFVLNDLLRWTVIHTSTLSNMSSDKTEALVKQDFGLMSRCLAAIPSKRPSVWETFLREIIAAHCGLTCLIVGLQTLVERNLHPKSDVASWVRCETLDRFAVEIGQGSRDVDLSSHLTAASSDAEEDSVETTHSQDAVYDLKLLFFTTCLGLTSDTGPCLVNRSVLVNWVETVTTSNFSQELVRQPGCGALLESLLQTLQNKRKLLTIDEIDCLVLQAWRCIEPYFEAYVADTLLQSSDLHPRFVHQAALETRETLNGFVHGANVIVKSWAIQSWRLVKLCQDGELALPSIGFDDLTLWSQHPDGMFSLSMSLMEKIETKLDRLRLIQSWRNGTNDATATILEILVSLSEASGNDVLVAAKSKARCDRCATFLDAMGGSSLAESDLVEWVVRLISRMCNWFESSETDERSNTEIQEVAVLSQLLSLMFKPITLYGMDVIEAKTVREGDRLWYISDPMAPAALEEVEIAKVHYDGQAGYYFTIRVNRDEGSQERQTVLDRLRTTKSLHDSRGCISVDCISEEELLKRSAIFGLLLKKMILPHSQEIALRPSLAELVSLSVGHLGVGKERGIGSSHYDIHRCLSATEQAVRTSIQDGGLTFGRGGLWSLSLASGFGLSVPESTWTVNHFQIDPFPLYALLLSHYKTVKSDTSLPDDIATVAWLIVSIDAALKFGDDFDMVLLQATILLFSLASRILATETKNLDFSGPAVLGCRAIQVGLDVRNQVKFKQILQDDEEVKMLSEVMQESLDILIRRFAVGWKSPATSSVTAWSTFSVFPKIVTSPHAHEFLASSGAKCADVLLELLYHPPKRYHSLLVLEKVALRGKVLENTDDVSLADSTTRCLQSWVKGLEEEEALEIEEDVYIVAEWVPLAIMVDLESWAACGSEPDEIIAVGRFLTWLVFLRFVDSATPKSFRNRPAFVSYLKRCGAVRSVLELALWHNETINDRKRKTVPSLLDMDALLKDESLLDVQRLSSLVLFRTIEVLPSLSRRWWEEDCPKVQSDAVQAFVEKYVSPEILKREMGRIKSATSFGPMTVSASQVSREVIASYVQDDFSLRVLISLPLAFPFRNAEVDCSKTLGVAPNRWKSWNLQITIMLNNQGGTLHDALVLWKENVEKEFEGVEPCPICYSVLHVKTHKLPALECKTCRNRFHFDCLTEWLRSSGKSQCVLCQQPWQGTRVT